MSDDTIRMNVRVNRLSQPELFDELSKIESKNVRGERLKSLAFAALIGMGAGISNPQASMPKSMQKPEPVENGIEQGDAEEPAEESQSIDPEVTSFLQKLTRTGEI